MYSFSSLLIAICVSFLASGSDAAPLAAAANGQIFVLSGDYQAGCVNENGAFVYHTGSIKKCPCVIIGVIANNSLKLSTAKGPCGIVSGTFKCGATAPTTTFVTDAFQPYSESYFFGNGKGFSGGLEYPKPSVILNSQAGIFEYSLAFSTAA